MIYFHLISSLSLSLSPFLSLSFSPLRLPRFFYARIPNSSLFNGYIHCKGIRMRVSCTSLGERLSRISPPTSFTCTMRSRKRATRAIQKLFYFIQIKTEWKRKPTRVLKILKRFDIITKYLYIGFFYEKER